MLRVPSDMDDEPYNIGVVGVYIYAKMEAFDFEGAFNCKRFGKFIILYYGSICITRHKLRIETAV